MRGLLTQRSFLGYALTAALAFGALFAYISGSPFVLQDIYGLSPQAFSIAFGVNGLGLVAGSQVNARLVGRFGPAYLLRRGAAGDRRRRPRRCSPSSRSAGSASGL